MIGSLIAAWLDVRSKPLRTVAAIAGMVAAVVAVILVDAAGVLSRDANDEYLARRYGMPVTASLSPIGDSPSAMASARLEAILRGNGIAAFSPAVGAGIQVLRGDHLALDSMTWVSSAYPSIRVVDLVAGEWPVATARSEVAHAVITVTKALELGYTPQQAVGQVIWYTARQGASTGDIRTVPLTPLVIDAVAAETSNAFDGTGILLVSNLPQPDLAPGPEFGGVSWLARVNPVDYGMLQELVGKITAPDGQPRYEARRVDQYDELAPVMAQQEVTAGAVTLVALMVGGLGILGVGLASVRERRREFGLQRALGASTLRIFAGVVLQSVLEALLAAALAVPLAAILLEIYARDLVLAELPLPASTALPLISAALGVAGALLVGLVAGLLPAASAARASVVQALRG